MARLNDGLINGFTKGFIPARIIEHIKIRCGGQEGFLCFFRSFIVFYDYPFRVASEWVGFKLENALS